MRPDDPNVGKRLEEMARESSAALKVCQTDEDGTPLLTCNTCHKRFLKSSMRCLEISKPNGKIQKFWFCEEHANSRISKSKLYVREVTHDTM